MIQKHLPGRRERDVVAVAVQQEHAEFFFELMNLHAQRGLRDVQAFGGLAEVQFLRGRHKIADVAEFHGASDVDNYT